MTSRSAKELPVHTVRAVAAAAAVISCCLLVARAASAQESGTVTVDVARCLEIESEAERSACFAAQVNEVLDTSATEAPAARSEADTNRRERQTEPAARPAAAERATEPESGEIFGTIVEIEERLPSAYIITLDNGQVWEQTEPKRYPLRPGLEVRVYPTRWGNRYRLTGIDSGGHIQVRRLR